MTEVDSENIVKIRNALQIITNNCGLLPLSKFAVHNKIIRQIKKIDSLLPPR